MSETYLKALSSFAYPFEPSVALAIQILDGAPFRLGGKIPMSVTQTKFKQKGDRFISRKVDNEKKKKLKKVEEKMLGWVNSEADVNVVYEQASSNPSLTLAKAMLLNEQKSLEHSSRCLTGNSSDRSSFGLLNLASTSEG
ncbi:hypothetical protein Patl1_23760 [Pistacia atlantica]|uniref:Uncharacterized protein n=1 Tax=Pistacia atlantica TaxID=434234 RepID=A0ACC0ZX94_9ROSI|nr:hypothetical protein Patl1_23760 [Pistacia atlantica]